MVNCLVFVLELKRALSLSKVFAWLKFFGNIFRTINFFLFLTGEVAILIFSL